MKPTFALNLSNERVGLLHRTGRGWLQVGDVAFDTPDLPEALAYLRRTALGLAPRGVTTKLVIPDSQILYIDVEAPGPDDETRRKQIAKGLVGRTPYAPEDLVFDWRGKGTMVKVAVVARETLQEAEAFAVEHRFNPVSFVALPEASSFKGEPFFGMTDAAKGTLPKGEAVDPDRDAMTIVTRDLPMADLAPEPEPKPAKTATSAEAAPAVAETTPVVAGDLSPELQVTAAIADPMQAPVPDFDVTPAPMWPEPKAEPIPTSTAHSTVLADSKTTIEEAPFAHVADPGGVTGDGLAMAEDDLPPAPSKAAQIAFASRRGTDDPRAQAASAKPGLTEFPGQVKGDFRSDFVAKRPNGALKTDAQVTAPSIPGSKKRKGGPTAPPPAVAAAAAALATSGALGTTTKPLTRPGGTFGAKPLPKRGKPRFLGLILTGLLLFALALIAAWSTYYIAQNDAGTEVDTAVSAAPSAAPAVNDEIAADQQDVTPNSGATLSDEVAAAVPSEDEGTAEASPDDAVAGDAETTALVTPADATQDDPEALADGEVGVVATDPTVSVDGTEPSPVDGATATLNEEVAPAEPAADAVVAAPGANTSTADVAAETTPPAPAAEVLAAAPDLEVGAAPQSRQADLPPDEIFLATTDVAPDFQDALVLPTPALSADATPAASPPPPPFGTVYRFGENGLIIPPPEGILSPDGIMLFAGAPPVTPPGRSAAVIAAAVAAAVAVPAPDAVPVTDPTTASDVAPPTPADPAMAGFRPRPRPATLTTPAQENADDASLGTVAAERAVTMRPRIRPDTILSTASAARNETANASLTAQSNAAVEEAVASAAATGNVMTLAVSRRPAAKPRDMSRAVEAAVAAAVRTPEPDPGQAENEFASNALPEDDAEPELASAAPKIPTKTNVAKQATFANAINLSKINLIGVYGTPSKRYALIRLASGRYKKVSVGDSVDGGQVAAITATEVRYQKGGRLVSLKLPKT